MSTRARDDQRIHPTAVVDSRAELAPDVEVGPYSVVGPGVRIGEGSRLVGHVVVTGPTHIGANNVFHPFSVIGGDPQIRKVLAGHGERAGRSALVIGEGG